MPPNKIAQLEAILVNSDGAKSPTSPSGFDEVVHTLTINTAPKLNVSDFRDYFDDVTEEQVAVAMKSGGSDESFTSIPFDPDYVEDESGTPTSHLAIIECIHGVKDPIIIGESQSVLVRELRDPNNTSDCRLKRPIYALNFWKS